MSPEPRDTSDWLDVRGDGGVLKRIIREGNKAAGLPIAGWCAKVFYDAYIEGGWFDGRQVDTTRDRPEQDGDYMFMVGDDHEAVKDGWVIRGLSAGCETMHRGEKAEFLFSPDYAYGAKGSTSHPKVPPRATTLNIWDSWHVSYHGCKAASGGIRSSSTGASLNAVSIIASATPTTATMTYC